MNIHDAAGVLVPYALRSGLLLVVGFLLPQVIRLHHPRTLLVYWRALLVIVLLLPLAPLEWTSRAASPYLTLDGIPVETVVASTLPESLPGLSWGLVLSVLGAVMALGLLRLALGLVYLNRCRRAARPLVPTPAPLIALQNRMGLEVPFVISQRLTVPLTYGWLRPTVLLPESFNDLSADQQEGVACHELLHVMRKDWPATLLEELFRAAVWFHPAVWLILPKIALCREQVVDADAIRLTGKRRPYLNALWSVVCTSRQSATAMAVPFLGRRDIVDRVAWLKKERSMSKTRIVLSVAVLSVALVAAGMVGAAAFAGNSISEYSITGRLSSEATEDEKADEADNDLETVAFDGICEEITRPVVIEKINPKYPPELREEKTMGEVVVRTIITEDGVVDQIEVLESDHPLFSEASIAAINQWRFDPALCDGTPVGVYYNLTVRFRLE